MVKTANKKINHSKVKTQSRHKPKNLTSEAKQKHAYKVKMQNKLSHKKQQAEILRQEREQAQQEKQARIKASKKKRLEKAKAMSKRTQRGQPLMKDRMELLYKQIQEMKRN